MELEEGYKRDAGYGSGKEICYTVEAMYDFPAPVEIAGQLFDNRWRRVQFQKGEFGVPAAPWFNEHTIKSGMLCYAAAQALRWWLHAVAECSGNGGICLATRIVKHELAHSYTITAVSWHDHIHGDDRSNCIPDWGKKPAEAAPVG